MPKTAPRRFSDHVQANLDKSIGFLRRTQQELRDRHQKLIEAHSELRRSQSRYRDLFDAAPFGYFTADMAGRIAETNKAAAALFAMSAAVLRGRCFEHLVSPGDRARFLQQLHRARRGPVSRPFEVQIQCVSGVRFPAHIILLRYGHKEHPGNELGVIIIDLTEAKATERELEAVRASLEKRVAERTRELQKTNAELSEQIARSTRLEGRLLEISERERRRFGQDLHDETCQSLTGLAMQLAVLYHRLQKDGVKMAPEFRDLAVNLNDLVNQTRRIAHGLHPVSLGDGLVSALHELAATMGDRFDCVVRADPVPVLSPEIGLALYRIAQEALNNTVKHAYASRVVIRLHRNASRLVLTVDDNGVGLPKVMPVRNGRGGMGLDILGYRARSIGGQLMIENLPRRGVRVTCHLPLTALRGGGGGGRNKRYSTPEARREEQRKKSTLRHRGNR